MALLYMGIGRSLFVAPHLDTTAHRHSLLQVTLSLDRPFAVRVGNAPWTRTRAIVLNSNTPHAFRDFTGMQATIHVVPEKHRAVHLRDNFLKGASARSFDSLDLSRYSAFFRDALEGESDCSTAFQVCERLIDDLTGARGYKEVLDERILAVLDFIEQNLSRRVFSRTLAKQVFLSEDRFLHLFKEQLGLPLRQYILYQRILRATLMILGGTSLTRAALDAGFSDSSHLTRKFIQLNGIRPSQMKGFRSTTRIFACSTARCLSPWSAGRTEPGALCPRCTRLHTSPSPPSDRS